MTANEEAPQSTETTTTERKNASQQNIMDAARGSGIIFGGRLIETAGRFIIGLIFARALGAEGYGVYGLADTTLAITTAIIMLGLDSSVVYYLPMFRNRREPEYVQGTILLGLVTPVVASIFAGAAIIWFRVDIAGWFNEPRLIPVLPLVALTVPFYAVLMMGSKITQGFKRMRYQVLAQDIIFSVVKIAAILFVLLFVGLTVFTATLTHLIAMVFASSAMLYFVYSLFPFLQSLRSARFSIRRIFKFSLLIYTSQLIYVFGPQVQTLFLGVLSTTADVGIFTVAYRVGMFGKMFHYSIVTVAMPNVSDLYSKRDWEQLGHFYQTATKWTFSFNLPFFLLVLLFPKPILSIFGESFVVGAEPLIVLTMATLVAAGTGICGVLITMTERPWLNTFNSILSLTTTVLLNLWLIPIMGLMGAAIARLVSTTIINGARIIQVYYMFRLQPYNRSFLKPIFAGAVAFIVSLTLNNLLFTELGLFEAVISGGVMVLVYAAMLPLLGLSEDDRMILQRVFHRLERFIPARFR